LAQLRLDTPVQYVKGVGPTRADQLTQLGIETVEDLLLYFPRRFDLRKQAQPIGTLTGSDGAVTIAGEVTHVSAKPYGKRPFFEAIIDDGTGWVALKWFHAMYLESRIRPGIHLAASGTVSVYRETVQIVNPQYQMLWAPEEVDLDKDELLPVYPAGAKLSSGVIGKIIHHVLPQAEHLLPRWFDMGYLEKRGLMTRPTAVAAMHRPEDTEHWGQARRRLAYDECMLMQLGIGLMRLRQVSRPAHPLAFSPEIDQRIRARFPFTLTDAQDAAVMEIVGDLGRDRPMNRLLQGDVGAGKTVVALYAMLAAVANRKQAVILAPTEVLATQHYRKIQEYLAGSKVRTELLVGGQSAIDRRRLLDGLAEGNVDIVVGTHALLSEGVIFSNLALVVVDEQHKFGVRQRTQMRGKGFAPHYLVMTATPIPRTLAMTVFGDLDCSIIDHLPPGRGTTTTTCTNLEKMDEVIDTVAKYLEDGQQAYFIYPLVNPSPQMQLTAAQQAYHELKAGPLGKYGVGLIHGQMPSDQKQSVMQQFREGHIKVLAASVIVEVGLDVPTANVMVITHAERFGLAQLHQLRGRIGRSEADAACILVSEPANPIARRRLEVLTETHDGFKIAEEDLRIRGPGEIFGTRQHGLPELKVADLVEDFELLRVARRDAFAIIAEDPGLAAPGHQQIRREMLAAYGDRLDLLTGA
jgi:ATP-dependent DNA helicase RecG